MCQILECYELCKNTFINTIESIKDNKEIFKWLLKNIKTLFTDICILNNVSLALFIVLNFNDEYFIEIQDGKIFDHTSIHDTRKLVLSDLHKNNSKTNWWLKGFQSNTNCNEYVICHIDKTNNFMTKCKHTFCADCLSEHFIKKIDCPYCRTKLLCDRRGSKYDYAIYQNSNHRMIPHATPQFTFFRGTYIRDYKFNLTPLESTNHRYNGNYDGDEINIFANQVTVEQVNVDETTSTSDNLIQIIPFESTFTDQNNVN